MAYMDEALKRKKEKKDISEMQESAFREYCSEMSTVVDSNKNWITSSIMGLKLMYSNLLHSGKIVASNCKSNELSNEYKRRLKSLVRSIMKGSVFKIGEVDKIFDEVRQGELNFVLDQVSSILSQ